MKKSDLQGQWTLLEVEYLPVEPGGDDGGFADEGMGTVSSAEELGLAKAFIEFKADGSFGGRYWTDETGEWSVDDGEALVTLHGDPLKLAIVDSLIERADFDDEAGRAMIVRYARAEKEAPKKPTKAKKLTAKLRKKIDKAWNLVCECDHMDASEIGALLDEGGEAAAKYMEGPESDVWLLSAAISNEHWGIATRLLDSGADPTLTEDGSLVQSVAQRTSSPETTALIALLREKGAPE